MRNEPPLPLPSNGRLISAGMAGAAAVGLLLNQRETAHHNYEPSLLYVDFT